MTRLLNPLLGRSAPAVTPIRRGGVTGRVGEFGLTRVSSSGQPKMHKGIDLLCPESWPVFAAHAGTVERAGYENPAKPSQGYGLRIWVRSADGAVATVYAHLSKLLVSPFDTVEAGQLIGLTGRSGNVGDGTPTHLHFEVHAPDPVDPARVLVEVA